MLVDDKLGEVAVCPCSDDMAALARVFQEVKDYSFLVSICEGKSDLLCLLLCPLPPQYKREIEKLEEVQQKGSKMVRVLQHNIWGMAKEGGLFQPEEEKTKSEGA